MISTARETEQKCWICGRTKKEIIEEFKIDVTLGEKIEDIKFDFYQTILLYDRTGKTVMYENGIFIHPLRKGQSEKDAPRINPADVIEMELGYYICSICINAIKQINLPYPTRLHKVPDVFHRDSA